MARTLAAAVALALLLAPAAPEAAAAAAAPPSPSPSSPPSPPANWVTFDAADAGFTAAFPGTPERLAHVTAASRMVLYEAGTADGRGFLAMIVFGDAAAGRVLDEVFVPNLREDGALEGERAVTLDGRPGRAFQARGAQSEVAFRRLAAFDRHYLLAVRVPAGKPFPEADARAFFESFRLRADATVPADLLPYDEDEEDEDDLFADGDEAPAAASAALPPAHPARGFRAFQARDAGFVVSFPGEPTRAEDDSSIDYAVEGRAGACDFSVMTFPHPEKVPAAALDDFVSGLARRFGAGVVRDEKVTIAGLDGRALSVALDEERIEARVLRGDRSVYVLLVEASGATPAQADLDAFFGSFRTLP